VGSSETPPKARKGDLVLVESISRNAYSMAAYQEARDAGRQLPETTASYQFGIVDSATRDGEVKTWRHLGESNCAAVIRYQRRWVTSAKTIDVNAVLTAAKTHHWPGHPDSPMPFPSLKDAIDVARPFLRRPAEVS
jgi:hypothetical protein